MSSELTENGPIRTAIWILGCISLGFSLWAIRLGFNNTLFDFHGFRQAQTAISVEMMVHGSSFLRYETPVFGPPWSLPFEFPLYQGIVAGLVKIFSSPVDQTGRVVAISFFYACFFPLASILFRAGLRGVEMIPSLAIFAVSPIYLFVSRLFMIESVALLFSLLYADQMFRLVISERKWRARYMVGAMVFGTLAGMVKVTTFASFFALGFCLLIWAVGKNRAGDRPRVTLLMAAALGCLMIPLAGTLWWTRFADGVRAQNPIGIYLVSKLLHAWTFGTLAQRLHPVIYLEFLDAANNHIGNIWLGMAILVAYIWLCRRWNWMAVACLMLYAGTTLVFFNLHHVHEYYPYSSAIFLVVAAGALITSMLRLPGRRAWIGVALLALELGACTQRYLGRYYPLQTENGPGRPEAARLVDTTTPAQSVILITGLEWSPEFPYQSHRRAIMDAFFPETTTWTVAPVEQAIANQGAGNIAALVACDEGRDGPRLTAFLRDLELPRSTEMHADDCDIYEHPPLVSDFNRNP